MAISVGPSAQVEYPFRDSANALEDRVSNILSLMTLEEKLACLTVSTAVPRFGIPNAGNSEGLHGLVRKATANSTAIPVARATIRPRSGRPGSDNADSVAPRPC